MKFLVALFVGALLTLAVAKERVETTKVVRPDTLHKIDTTKKVVWDTVIYTIKWNDTTLFISKDSVVKKSKLKK